jgi:hypothetical protein
MRLTLILIVTILLASCADLQAYVPGVEPTAQPATATFEHPTATPSETATPVRTIMPGWAVCTGLEGGYLNVRACAGTGCMAVAVLREGREVQVTRAEETRSGGRWVLISEPTQGWVNTKYLCKRSSE